MSELDRELELPGFRFHPTEEELLDFYLKNMVCSKNSRVEVIGFLNIYRHDPWDLPGLSKIGEREWYFFVPRDRKHGSGGRPNRTTEKGFWKATGSDRKIVSLSEPKRVIGLRKTLVFYRGRAPRGTKTDWVMNEYRLPDGFPWPKDIVLCKIYRKATPLKTLEQRAAQEELDIKPTASPPSSFETFKFYSHQEDFVAQETRSERPEMLFMEVSEDPSLQEGSVGKPTANEDENATKEKKTSSLKLPFGMTELQVPKLGMEWAPDPFWSLSPWLQSLTPSANILNF